MTVITEKEESDKKLLNYDNTPGLISDNITNENQRSPPPKAKRSQSKRGSQKSFNSK